MNMKLPEKLLCCVFSFYDIARTIHGISSSLCIIAEEGGLHPVASGTLTKLLGGLLLLLDEYGQVCISVVSMNNIFDTFVISNFDIKKSSVVGLPI